MICTHSESNDEGTRRSRDDAATARTLLIHSPPSLLFLSSLDGLSSCTYLYHHHVPPFFFLLFDWINQLDESTEQNHRWPYALTIHARDLARLQKVHIHPRDTHRDPFRALRNILGSTWKLFLAKCHSIRPCPTPAQRDAGALWISRRRSADAHRPR